MNKNNFLSVQFLTFIVLHLILFKAGETKNAKQRTNQESLLVSIIFFSSNICLAISSFQTNYNKDKSLFFLLGTNKKNKLYTLHIVKQ